MPKKATGIKLNKRSVILTPGARFKLEPEILPTDADDTEYDVISDNPTIAGCSYGSYIYGSREGTAAIQVRLKSSGITALCLVKVIAGFESP